MLVISSTASVRTWIWFSHVRLYISMFFLTTWLLGLAAKASAALITCKDVECSHSDFFGTSYHCTGDSHSFKKLDAFIFNNRENGKMPSSVTPSFAFGNNFILFWRITELTLELLIEFHSLRTQKIQR